MKPYRRINSAAELKALHLEAKEAGQKAVGLSKGNILYAWDETVDQPRPITPEVAAYRLGLTVPQVNKIVETGCEVVFEQPKPEPVAVVVDPLDDLDELIEVPAVVVEPEPIQEPQPEPEKEAEPIQEPQPEPVQAQAQEPHPNQAEEYVKQVSAKWQNAFEQLGKDLRVALDNFSKSIQE